MSPSRPKLLIVDDGERYAEVAHAFLRDYDYATRCDQPGPCWTCPHRTGCTLTHAHDLAEAEEALAAHPDVDVVLLDVAFELPNRQLAPTMEEDPDRRRRLQGIDILTALRRRRGRLRVILMTSQEELGFEEQALAVAADEFVTLAGADAFDARALALLVERVIKRGRDTVSGSGYFWGKTAKMARLRRDALTLARTSLPILLLGETGCGKSALAEQVLHPATGRRGPFVAVDLAALPATLLSAELFGTSRGAFSGAVDRVGRFEAANNGTLLLDEIGNLPLELQRLLLLALEAGRITRLGESSPRPVNVKLIAATNSDLAAAVGAGHFRADLYARLNPAASLRIPPLRERMEDLEELLDAFLQRAFEAGPDRALLSDYLDRARLGGPVKARLTIGALPELQRGITFVLQAAIARELKAHPFPGNVRELEMLIVSAALFALSDALAAAEQGRGGGENASTIFIPARLVRELLAAPAANGPGFVLRPQSSLRRAAQFVERQLYERLYEETGGDFLAMARRLLEKPQPADARRVRLRFNQLGLRVRKS